LPRCGTSTGILVEIVVGIEIFADIVGENLLDL